jgi:glycosyl hydrolase family 20
MAKVAFEYRGVMIDPARLMERHDYYVGLLPQLAEWGYNLLHLHIVDDQGCGLVFPSHPELATKHAFTVDEMQAFCAEAARLGIEVVPEIECFGHTDFITRHKKYKHLREIDEGPGRFSGMCVFEPEAKQILEDLLTDTMDIFNPRLIHAGLDEVNFGHHPASKKLLKKRAKNELFADHINWCHEVISGLGARMAMWGDHLLPSHDDGTIVDRTPKDTVIFDWHYNADFKPDSIDFFIDRGFEVYGAPAIQHSACRIMTGEHNFENCQRFAGYALQRRTPKRGKGCVTGMVVTSWCPCRHVPGTIEYPLAVCGQLFSDEALLPADFAQTFAHEFWGLDGEVCADVAQAVETVYAAAPDRNQYSRVMFGSGGAGRTASFSRFDQHIAREWLPVIADAATVLSAAVKAATKNKGRLRDLVVGAEFLKAFYQYGANGAKGNPGWSKVRKLMQAAWKRVRYCDTPAYSAKTARYPVGRGGQDAVIKHLNRLVD